MINPTAIMEQRDQMDENMELELARRLIEQTGTSLFLTGKAGTGKTTFLRKLRRESRKRMIVTAPTGIAAINAGGVTLHSFFQLDFGVQLPGVQRDPSRRSLAFGKEKIRMIRGLDLLVIDEVSMVRADMLDAVDRVLRRFRDPALPFGGIQLLLIGDLQQLPPVVTTNEQALMSANYRSPYFFDSHALEEVDYVTIELSKVYRQNEGEFLDILNSIRANSVTPQILARLNSRVIPNFNPDESEGYIRLTTHNRYADEINRVRLEALTSEPHTFEARIQGKFPESSYPVDYNMTLKEGEQVMFVKNDTGTERRFFNGMLGRVTSIDDSGIGVTPVDSDIPILVEPAEWENVKFVINEQTKQIEEKVEGIFQQLPLKPAWAITIHKSQGLTFDKAIINAAASFTHGQTYVALSRCRSMEGLVLDQPIPPGAIISDRTVSDFISSHTIPDLNEKYLNNLEEEYANRLQESLLNFRPLYANLDALIRILKEYFMSTFPSQVIEFDREIAQKREYLEPITARSITHLRNVAQSSGEEAHNQRFKDACRFFLSQLDEIISMADNLPEEHDSSKVTTLYEERLTAFREAALLRRSLLDTFRIEEFDSGLFLEVKAETIYRQQLNARKGRKSAITTETAKFSDDNINPILFVRLKEWRTSKSQELNLPAYVVAQTKGLLSIANYLPVSYDAMKLLPHIGDIFIAKYGDDVLDIVDSYLEEFPESPKLEIIPTKQKPKKEKAEKPKKEKIEKPKKEKVEKPKKEKQPKLNDSKKQSYEAFKSGKSIEEIAAERGLKAETIKSHLVEAVKPEEEKLISKLIRPAIRTALENYLNTLTEEPTGLTEIRQALADLPEYTEIKLMLRLRRLKQEEAQTKPL